MSIDARPTRPVRAPVIKRLRQTMLLSLVLSCLSPGCSGDADGWHRGARCGNAHGFLHIGEPDRRRDRRGHDNHSPIVGRFRP